MNLPETPIYDPDAPKKAKNLYVNQSLLECASQFNINVSKACELGLLMQIADAQAKRWREENRDALDSSNDYVERHGLPLKNSGASEWRSSICMRSRGDICWTFSPN